MALLPPYRMFVQARDRHGHVLLGQAVERVQQFHVLEVVGSEEKHLASSEHHAADPTP
jgi:hypothetical protein